LITKIYVLGKEEKMHHKERRILIISVTVLVWRLHTATRQ